MSNEPPFRNAHKSSASSYYLTGKQVAISIHSDDWHALKLLSLIEGSSLQTVLLRLLQNSLAQEGITLESVKEKCVERLSEAWMNESSGKYDNVHEFLDAMCVILEKKKIDVDIVADIMDDFYRYEEQTKK